MNLLGAGGVSLGAHVKAHVHISANMSTFVHAHVAQINSIFHVNNEGYRVTAEATQVVAGTNHFLHLEGETDGLKYQVTVFVPLVGDAEITEVLEGHGELKA
jgi:hypothetical protein